MSHVTVSIDESGTITQLSGHGPNLLDVYGGMVQTRRASHVEPANRVLRVIFHALRLTGDDSRIAQYTRIWPCAWRVNLSPVHGPILTTMYRNRQSAINAEIAWLTDNWL